MAYVLGQWENILQCFLPSWSQDLLISFSYKGYTLQVGAWLEGEMLTVFHWQDLFVFRLGAPKWRGSLFRPCWPCTFTLLQAHMAPWRTGTGFASAQPSILDSWWLNNTNSFNGCIHACAKYQYLTHRRVAAEMCDDSGLSMNLLTSKLKLDLSCHLLCRLKPLGLLKSGMYVIRGISTPSKSRDLLQWVQLNLWT